MSHRETLHVIKCNDVYNDYIILFIIIIKWYLGYVVLLDDMDWQATKSQLSEEGRIDLCRIYFLHMHDIDWRLKPVLAITLCLSLSGNQFCSVYDYVQTTEKVICPSVDFGIVQVFFWCRFQSFNPLTKTIITRNWHYIYCFKSSQITKSQTLERNRCAEKEDC